MTATFDLISEQVLSSAASSVTFSSIPQGFKDLVLEITGFGTTASFVDLRVNGDNAGNYSRTGMTGTSSGAGSFRESNQGRTTIDFGSSSSILGTGIADFQSYANTNVFKTILTRGYNSNAVVIAQVTLWRSTSAITSITLSAPSGNIGAGTTVRLFGIVG